MANQGLGSPDVYFKGRQIQVSTDIAHQISLRAAEIVRRTAPVGINNSRQLVRATWQKGQIGIHFPPKAIHLLYLDRGIKPFVMTALEGKVVPIRNSNGSISFRKAKNVGSPRILTRDGNGRILQSKIAWRFPGIEPMNFVQPAINQAIEEFFSSIEDVKMMELLQQMPGEIGTFFKRFKRV